MCEATPPVVLLRGRKAEVEALAEPSSSSFLFLGLQELLEAGPLSLLLLLLQLAPQGVGLLLEQFCGGVDLLLELSFSLAFLEDSENLAGLLLDECTFAVEVARERLEKLAVRAPLLVVLQHLADQPDGQLGDLSVGGLRVEAELVQRGLAPPPWQCVHALQRLCLQEVLLADTFGHQDRHNWPDDFAGQFGELLRFDDFCEESEGFFGVVASQVFNLCDDVFGVGWQEFVEEEGGVVLVGLSECGCVGWEGIKRRIGGQQHSHLMISSEKKIWSEEEDAILQRLYEEEGVQNWSLVAKRMAGDYNLPRKSAKQCRERYENHINQETAKVEWTAEEELRLVQLHDQIGNKWSLIAQGIPTKTDNTIKNHFYSKLRKVLRKLNAVIHTHFRREFREISISVVYKLVEGCEELFKETPGCDRAVSMACREVQNKMLGLSLLKEEQFDSEERIAIYREVVREVYAASKLYKRKSKKSRNSSIQAPNLKGRRNKQVILVAEPPDSHTPSDSHQLSHEDSHPPIPTHPPSPLPKKNDVVVKDEEQGIKDLLKDAGLLQFGDVEAHSMNGFRFSSRSSFKSYSEKNDSDQQFFEDSELERGFYTKTRRGSCFRFVENPSERSEGEAAQESFFH